MTTNFGFCQLEEFYMDNKTTVANRSKSTKEGNTDDSKAYVAVSDYKAASPEELSFK